MVGKGSRCYKKVFSVFVIHGTICHYMHRLCAADIIYTSYTTNIEYVEISCYHTLYANYLKDTNFVCIEDLHLLNCMLPCLHPVVASVFITGFISTAATAVITSIVCMVMQKKRRSKELVPSTTSPGPVYDDVTEIRQRKETFELASNIAYAIPKN